MEKFRWMLELPHMIVKNPEGRSRGIALFWKRSVNVSLRSVGRRHIDIDTTNGDGRMWRMTGIYGESQGDLKPETWRTMRTLKQQHQDGRPWLCLGDFNEILSNSEKAGGVPRPQSCMDSFRNTLQFCELADLGFEGDLYTWRNHSKNVETYMSERLDRATASSEWCALYPNFRVVHGDTYHSDHRPIIVYLDEEAISSTCIAKGPFRFEARWLQEEGCDEVIEKAWKDGWDRGGQNVLDALRSVANHLQSWDENVVGDLGRRLKTAKKELNKCMMKPISQEKVSEEARLWCRLELLEEMNNTKWKQCAHAWWL
jgi:hypothetical protein